MRADETVDRYERDWGRFRNWLSRVAPNSDPSKADGNAVARYLRSCGGAYTTLKRHAFAVAARLRVSNPGSWPPGELPEEVAAVIREARESPRGRLAPAAA